MQNPATFTAYAIAAALAFTACTLKKAEVHPEYETDPIASLDKDSQLPEEASYPLEEKRDATAAAPKPKALMDRLYPQASADRKNLDGGPAHAQGNPSVTQPAPQMEAHVRSESQAPIPSSLGAVSKSTAAPASPMRPSARESLRGREAFRYEDSYRPDCGNCVPKPPANTETYAAIRENAFLDAKTDPLSTFSIDVDGASYSNTRRFIQEGGLPPADAVRIEEFINYFDYGYPQPSGIDPFSITTEVAAAPWNPETRLVHIGLQGRNVRADKAPPSNLVFLIDVSGSMSSPDKLPLLKDAFDMLIDQMRPQDRISIVVYAGSAGMVLPPTSGSDKETIRESLSRLEAGGSTAGGAGLMLAYRAAKDGFIKGGSNRVILATDGDFNVGVSGDEELARLIEEKRKTGVFLSVLGFGTGNYKDSKMEGIADKGNGNYFYIDNINEARKVLVEKVHGTLHAIAKDVKLQIEFNPAAVKSYRLIGYENRVLAAEDFNDDRKDAGELGAGTNVTALYEIVPAGPSRPKVDPLKYGRPTPRWRGFRGEERGSASELLTVKFRYKHPAGTESRLISRVVRGNDLAGGEAAAWQEASESFRFAAAAAGFGLVLRGSQHAGDLDYAKVAGMARGAKGRDSQGRRAEFIALVEAAASLSGAAQVGYRE